jgi:hypothetical protein
MPPDNQTIEQWWEEDAERVNDLGRAAARKGVAVDLGVEPPVPEIGDEDELSEEGAE